jgi:hypothetical protein
MTGDDDISGWRQINHLENTGAAGEHHDPRRMVGSANDRPLDGRHVALPPGDCSYDRATGPVLLCGRKRNGWNR